MDEDLKQSLALLTHNPAFKSFMAAIENAREAEIAALASDAAVGNPQVLAAMAGSIRTFNAIIDLWKQSAAEAVG